MKHTQGKWEAYKRGHFFGVKAGTKPVADMYNGIDMLKGEASANAALISAAPDMLDALKEAQKFIRTKAGLPGTGNLLADVDNAILKAEGGE